ncbi:hypothetical protein KP509_10G015000 [Ceratopteris richardii]|uniref:Uncharacterized protein n=1 Tax=Ceratopteris richardii TaxID=49495 RepID=A0A8T2TZ92_CERRI|nr:hypothetical protein KP509_10G015000 [Ceratopteris richardii]
MGVSHPAVHPVTVPLLITDPPVRLRMKGHPGVLDIMVGLALRLSQSGFAVLSFSIMVCTPDFVQVTAFCCLVAATIF